MRMPLRALVLALLGVALLAAGGLGGYLIADDDAETAATASTRVQSDDWSLCTNPLQGYSVGYPGGWFTDHLTVADACMLFNPIRFRVLPGTDCCQTALVVHGETESFQKVVRGFAFGGTLERTELTIHGHRAARIESVSNGKGLYPAGVRIYAYVLERGSKAFVVETFSFTCDYAASKKIVDRAVRTLRFFRPHPAVAIQAGLPAAVAQTRAKIAEAAARGDLVSLAKLTGKHFSYTFGGSVRGGASVYWQRLELRGESPLSTLAAILQRRYVHRGRYYEWPAGARLGWRTGIRADGRWAYFVAGD